MARMKFRKKVVRDRESSASNSGLKKEKQLSDTNTTTGLSTTNTESYQLPLEKSTSSETTGTGETDSNTDSSKSPEIEVFGSHAEAEKKGCRNCGERFDSKESGHYWDYWIARCPSCGENTNYKVIYQY